MELIVKNDASATVLATQLVTELKELGFEARSVPLKLEVPRADEIQVVLTLDDGQGTAYHDRGLIVSTNSPLSLVEQALRHVPLDFESLPMFVTGDSKIIRSWTSQLVVEKFKPTVYSYTHNRYGESPGTDAIRARFAAEVFRRMARIDANTPNKPRSAFVALLESCEGPLLVQRRVESCNLEVRVKRYHIGSPVHRYLYTEKYPTTMRCGPLRKWSRLDTPLVCFDWRHPLTDEEGKRLADEPISDDYATVWMENVSGAKEMCRNTFLWLEELFAKKGYVLVDMCVFIDYTGKTLYGEISPDCMRVRKLDVSETGKSLDILTLDARALDKDVWRQGGSADDVAARYAELFDAVFS